MRISNIKLGNFKGIEGEISVEIKPITVFIGKNSAGKSTCLHGLSALSQSLKLPNNSRALTLDDEFAYVHLGRFIEASHSGRYEDSITLGLTVEGIRIPTFEKGESPRLGAEPGQIQAEYSFRSTLRTQDVSIERVRYSFGDKTFEIQNRNKNYVLRLGGNSKARLLSRRQAFLFDLAYQSANKISSFWVFYAFQQIQDVISNALRRVFYLGPFRQPPLRRYPTHGTGPEEVGPQGEATVTLLANETIQSQRRGHIKQISKWLRVMGLGSNVEISRVGRSDLFETQVTLPDGVQLSVADLGYGVSQALPVLAQCSFAPSEATLLFEQPELHLHQEAARELSRIFVETCKRGITIIIETHSPEIVNGLQQRLRENAITPNEIALYNVKRERNATRIFRQELEADGDAYGSWDSDVR